MAMSDPLKDSLNYVRRIRQLEDQLAEATAEAIRLKHRVAELEADLTSKLVILDNLRLRPWWGR